MSRNYDNWERLVAAVVKKQQLWELFHQQSRSPSIRSEASDLTSSYSFRSLIHDEAISLLSPLETFAELHPKLVLVTDFNPAFDAENVFRASTELLGRGNFASTYTVVMENGITVVMKRLKPGITSEAEFKRNMKIVGNINHANVIPLRAYYSYKEERLMFYDHYSQGSVYSLLHGRNDGRKAHVSWETRLRIAIGAARGIDEIHAQNDGKFVHGNIKSSNIFVNYHYGCISDLGLPTAWCYAPEVEKTRNMSQASDVYSFGILILELLTRKSLVHVPGGPRVVDLVKFVTSVKSNVRGVRVFDADLLKKPQIKDNLVKMLQIGILCVAKSLKKRPKMSAVVQMLEDINVKVTRSPVSRKLEFIENSYPYSLLADMLKIEYAEVIGKGTFGISYKFVIGNGNKIRVKRIRDTKVSLEEFHQHAEFIGRMRHENVCALRAYIYAKDEKLLVYNYNYQSSVFTLLHEKRESDPLDWAARLKIAIGAAKGIAYIHRQAGQTFVHGNIKSTNIFLNKQHFGLIADAGLTKLTNSIKLTPGYCAPEVINTKSVSQASDVYSFGVVLLELATGKPSKHYTSDGEFVSLIKWIQSFTHKEWTNVVVDKELLRYENDLEPMERLLQIGLDCVASAPKHRPTMTQVVMMLDEIGGFSTVQQLSVESRLAYLLEDLLPMVVFE